jgi:transposase
MTKTLRNRIAAHYRAGHSMRRTAARFGLSFPDVRRILRRDCPGDIRPRHQRSPQREARDRAIVGHYRRGHGVVETAARFGLSVKQIRNILRRDCHGHVRPPGRPLRLRADVLRPEIEYRRAKAAERARQDAEIEKIWPEKDAYSHRREAPPS